MKTSSARMFAAALVASAAIAACASVPRSHMSTGALPAAGQAGLSPAAMARADSGRPPYTAADVNFMSGMIGHHAQAVLMACWAPTHGASPAVRALCERIVVGQTDEIGLMQRWLRERHETVPAADPRGHRMAGMDHPMLMPGMLSPEQMSELDRAHGTDFDRLFLLGMIMHHQGAIIMVDELMSAYGAAQDGIVYKFSSDVYADQTTEIERMTRMLNAVMPAGRSPQ